MVKHTQIVWVCLTTLWGWRMKKDEKNSNVIQTTDTLSNYSESNHLCYSIAFFSKFEFGTMDCSVFRQIRNRLIAKLYVIKDHWALFSLWFKITIVTYCLTESTVYSLLYSQWKRIVSVRKLIFSVPQYFSATTVLFYDEGPYHIETSPMIYRANHWTGFYMIRTFVMKEYCSHWKVLGHWKDQFLCTDYKHHASLI